jgi:hypothetical protein
VHVCVRACVRACVQGSGTYSYITGDNRWAYVGNTCFGKYGEAAGRVQGHATFATPDHDVETTQDNNSSKDVAFSVASSHRVQLVEARV